MNRKELLDSLERVPVIAAVKDNGFDSALNSPTEVIFYLKANILTVAQRVKAAKEKGKTVFVHIDLAEGVGKDRAGVEYLAKCGVDGIISTRSQLVAIAKDFGLLTVQRFFALDSQGLDSLRDMSANTCADMFEIMPGVIGKIIERFKNGPVPVIAGGLIETKAEVTGAIAAGATAVSTGKKELWYV